MVEARRTEMGSVANPTPIQPWSTGMRPTLKLYHGGVPGLEPGQKLQPPSRTGTRSCSGYDSQHCRPDRVYLTTDSNEAAVYAALAPWGGRGDVYEVEPNGKLESDPPDEPGTGSYAAPTATVIAVMRRGVYLEEAAARLSPSCWRRLAGYREDLIERRADQ